MGRVFDLGQGHRDFGSLAQWGILNSEPREKMGGEDEIRSQTEYIARKESGAILEISPRTVPKCPSFLAQARIYQARKNSAEGPGTRQILAFQLDEQSISYETAATALRATSWEPALVLEI